MPKILTVFILLTSVILLSSCAPAPTGSPNLPSVPAVPPTPSVMPCVVVHAPFTPQALGAQFEGRGHVSGPVEAPVTIVVFSDYQCPACAFLAASLKQIRLTHPADVRLIYVNTPRSDHENSEMAIRAVEAADLQGKFWEMHDLLYEQQAKWINLAPAEFESWTAEQAAGLGLDAAQFQADFNSDVVTARIQIISSAGDQSIPLPVLFVNSNSPYASLADFASLDTVIRMEALAARQFSACPPWIIDPLKQYIATLQTTRGQVVIQLFPDKAPLAVNNFVFLARNGWFDNITFHRVLPGSVAQTGDPSGTGFGNPGYYFETEATNELSFNQAGMVGMVNSGLDTNGSQFFITYSPATNLDGGYTIFGQVLTGMDVLAALSPRDPQPGIYLPSGDSLIRVTIEER